MKNMSLKRLYWVPFSYACSFLVALHFLLGIEYTTWVKSFKVFVVVVIVSLNNTVSNGLRVRSVCRMEQLLNAFIIACTHKTSHYNNIDTIRVSITRVRRFYVSVRQWIHSSSTLLGCMKSHSSYGKSELTWKHLSVHIRFVKRSKAITLPNKENDYLH